MEPNGYQFPQIVISFGERQLWPDGALAANTPLGRTLPFLTKWFPPLSRGWHCPQGVLPARGRSAKCCRGFRQFTLARRMA